MGFVKLSNEYYTRWCSEHEDGLTDDNLILSHELLQRANFEKIVFFDRETPLARLEYLQWAKCERKMFFMLFKQDGTPIAIGWLTDPSATGRQTFAHFSTLETAPIGESIAALRQLIRFIGRYTKVKELIGLTPCCYRHAIRFSRELGFQPLTVLKKAVMCLGKERDALLSICYTNGEYNGRNGY